MRIKKYLDRKLICSGLAVALGASVCFCFFNNLPAVRAWVRTVLSYLAPVTWGLMLAYLIRPFARFLENRVLTRIKSEKARVHISSIATVLLFLILIVFVIANVIPQVVNSVSNFVANFDGYLSSARSVISQYAKRVAIADIDADKFIGTGDEIFRKIGTWLTGNVSTFIGFFYALSGQLLNFVIVIAMAIYALLDRKNLKKGLIRLANALLDENKVARARAIFTRGDVLMTRFLASNLLDAVIIGVVNFIFLSIFKAPYTALLSVLLGVFNFVPTFGPISGGIIASVIVLLTKPTLLLGFILFTVVLQQIDGNVIKPLLFGDSTGLSPFWVLVAIVVCGRMFGVLGMVLGVPALALVYSLYNELLEKKAQRKAADCPPEKRE